MANMGCCRFENTESDLRDCYDHMDDPKLSESERVARNRIIGLCCEIAVDYGYEVGREVEQV